MQHLPRQASLRSAKAAAEMPFNIALNGGWRLPRSALRRADLPPVLPSSAWCQPGQRHHPLPGQTQRLPKRLLGSTRPIRTGQPVSISAGLCFELAAKCTMSSPESHPGQVLLGHGHLPSPDRRAQPANTSRTNQCSLGPVFLLAATEYN